MRTRDGASEISLLDDGTAIINGDADFAVAYTDLKTAFDQLKTDYDTFISTKYNMHVHPGVTAGAASTAVTLTVGSSSTADMAGAKVATVKLP
jgi:hypothetical protein